MPAKTLLALLILLLVWYPPNDSRSQQSKPIPTTDTSVNVSVTDTVFAKMLDKISSNNKEILQATIPLKQADKKLTTSLKKLEKYVAKKDEVVESTVKVTVVEKIEKPKVVRKKTFWQKIKSIFKHKRKKS